MKLSLIMTINILALLVGCSSLGQQSRNIASLKPNDCKITNIGIAGGSHKDLVTVKETLAEKGYDVSGLRPDMNWGAEWSQTNEISDEYGNAEDVNSGMRGWKGVVVQIDREYRFRTMRIVPYSTNKPHGLADKFANAWNEARLLAQEKKDIKQAKRRAKKEGVSYEFTKISKWKDSRADRFEKTYDGHIEVKRDELIELFKDYPACNL